MTTLTLTLAALAFAAVGYWLGRSTVRQVVTLARRSENWIERANGTRERIHYTPEQLFALVERCATQHRLIMKLTDWKVLHLQTEAEERRWRRELN